MESPMSGRNVKGHRIAKENIISIAVCIVLVTLRFYARIAILRKVRATDYVILLSLVNLLQPLSSSSMVSIDLQPS